MRLAWAAALVLHSLATEATHALYPDRLQTTLTTGASATQWSFTEGIHPNSTSHLIFDTVNSLLQQWTNTRYRNGHTIVPGSIPRGTLLYHGTIKKVIPAAPDWVATDPEHSYLFAAPWHLTLVATRPLKVLYFDGSSAAKVETGTMDSQDLLVWGETKPGWSYREKDRINGLCEWGKKFGIDGYVRMQMDFEIMLCDFTAGVKPIFFLELDSMNKPPPRSPKPPPTSPQAPTGEPPAAYRVVESGQWHNRSPGETRVKLDYSRLISFYDPGLFPSLQASRQKATQEGHDRWDHRIEHIQKEEVEVLKKKLNVVLTNEASAETGSGVDWKTLFQVVHDRYAERLEVLLYLLNSTSTPNSEPEKIQQGVRRAHTHITSMIAPYILRSIVPPTSVSSAPANYTWALPVFQHCATTHTRYLEEDDVFSSMTPSEKVLLKAVKDVSKEICRTLVRSWAEGVEAGLPMAGDSETTDLQLDIGSGWYTNVDSLMKWLDWSHWVRCRPGCGYEEICYLPTWPFFCERPPMVPHSSPTSSLDMPPGLKQARPPCWVWNPKDGTDSDESDMAPSDEDDREDWVRPQPRCVRRIAPFGPF